MDSRAGNEPRSRRSRDPGPHASEKTGERASKAMSLHDGLNLLRQGAARFWRLFTAADLRRRRLAGQAEAAAESLVRVGHVVMPFKDIVAAGLAARRVPQREIHAEVQHCIRQAIEAAQSPTPAVWFRNRAIVAEVTRNAMRWRAPPGDQGGLRNAGPAHGIARDAGRNRRPRRS